MIGEYYTTGTRIRGSHGNIQHTNRTYFGSNRAISLDQYSNSRRMSDGIQIQTVVSDNSVYYHQRQHRSLEHDSTGMYSSSDKSTSLNSNNEQPQQQHQQPIGPASFQSSHHAHLHHHHYQQAAAALHQMRAVQDCENMNISVPPTTTSGKMYATFNNNSSNNNKNIGKKMNWSQHQKLESLRKASNNNNNGHNVEGGNERDGTSKMTGNGKNGGCNGTSETTSKSIISRLRQLTGRFSFNFDSKESKKLQLLAASSGEEANDSEPDGSGKGSCALRKIRLLEKSKTVDVGGTVAICGDSVESADDFCCAGGMVLNQPKSISPILMQHRNSDVINTINSARNRAYSLDVPLSRNCCRSLSGSTAGGGGSSCGGSQKSITFSLNKSLNEEVNDATISSGGGGGGCVRLPSLDDTTRNGGSVSETI